MNCQDVECSEEVVEQGETREWYVKRCPKCGKTRTIGYVERYAVDKSKRELNGAHLEEVGGKLAYVFMLPCVGGCRDA